MDIVLSTIVVALCAFVIYEIGLVLQSKIVLLVAFFGCTVAMFLGLFVMVIRYRESRR